MGNRKVKNEDYYVWYDVENLPFEDYCEWYDDGDFPYLKEQILDTSGLSKNRFREMILIAIRILEENCEDYGVCGAIGQAITPNYVSYIHIVLFRRLFQPRSLKSNNIIKGLDGNMNMWLGNPSKERLQRRIDTLLFFEQFVLTDVYGEEL